MKRYSYHSLLRPSFEQSLTVPYLVRSINQIKRTTWRRLSVNIGLDKQWYAYPFSVKELPNFLWNSSLLCNWSSPSLDTTPRLLSLRKFITIYISRTHQEWKQKKFTDSSENTNLFIPVGNRSDDYQDDSLQADASYHARPNALQQTSKVRNLH